MREPGLGVGGSDGGQAGRDRLLQGVVAARAGAPEGALELAEGVLDRGEVGGVRRQVEEAAAALLWTLRLSQTTHWPGASLGAKTRATKTSKASRSAAPSSVIAAVIPARPIAAIRVVLGPWLRGTVPITRSPRRARPYRGVIARFVPLSSTKTSVAGSTQSLVSHQSARRASSRSAAWRTFCDRDAEAADGARHRRDADGSSLPTGRERAVVGQRGVGVGGDLRA